MAETEIELNIDIKKFDLLPRLILDGRSQGHRHTENLKMK